MTGPSAPAEFGSRGCPTLRGTAVHVTGQLAQAKCPAAAKPWSAEYDPEGMAAKVQELIARLEADGWYLARQKGSHRQFHHSVKVGTVTVAGKPSVEIPPGTLNSILKQAGFKK